VQERHVELGPDQKPKKITVMDRHVPGNVAAEIFWLKNRMRERWRDIRQIEANVQQGGPPQLPEDISEEDLEVVTSNLKLLMPELFDGKERAGKN